MANTCYVDKQGRVWALSPDGTSLKNIPANTSERPWDGISPDESWGRPWSYNSEDNSLSELVTEQKRLRKLRRLIFLEDLKERNNSIIDKLKLARPSDASRLENLKIT